MTNHAGGSKVLMECHANSQSGEGNQCIHILHLLWSLDRAGAELLVLDIVRLSDRSRFRHSICCLGNNTALAAAFDRQGSPPIVLGKARKGDNIGILLKAAAFVRKERPDVLHVHREGPDIWGDLIAWLGRSRMLIATEHNPFDATIDPTFIRVAIRRAFRQRLNHVVTVSKAVQRSILAFRVAAPNQVSVIHNGIDTSKFRPESRRALRSEELIIGTTGRLTKQKGHVFLLRAASRLNALYPGLRVRIAGEGALREDLEREAHNLGVGDIVSFVGVIDDVPEFLSQLDIFVFPSVFEGFGIALIEAMSCGLPTVASAVGGIVDVVRDEVDGLLVAPSDADALAEAINRYVLDPEFARDTGNRARERVVKSFDVRRMMALYEDRYEEAAIQANESL